jgi:hypothetical protein
MNRGSYLLRAALGFVTGSAVGWVAHDRLDKSATFGTGGCDDSDNIITKLCPLPGMKTFKVTSPWDDNWDRYRGLFVVSVLVECGCILQ